MDESTSMSSKKILLLITAGAFAAFLLRRSFKAHRETERQTAQEAARCIAARLEAERLAAGESADRKAERQATEEAARREAEKLAVTETTSQKEAPLRVLDTAVPRTGLKAKTPEQTVVMIADDSKVVRVKTGRLLAASNYQVVMAVDGLDAVQQIGNSIPDLLITDVDMPGMGGMELVRQLRSHSRTAHIPIIMITSDSDVLRREAFESGVNVVLGKPYPEEQLITHIQKLLNDQFNC